MKYCILFAIAALCVLGVIVFLTPERIYIDSFGVMSTEASYCLKGEHADRGDALIKEAFRQTEQHCNFFNPASELARLNAQAADTPFVCSPYLWEVLRYSREMYAFSDGAFDITARPLMKLWGFHKKRLTLPTQAECDSALRLVGLDKVRFNDSERSVFFPVRGMCLDCGGIAKGYAVDCACDALIAHGIRRGIVNLGGNIRVLPDEDFTIYLRDPIKETNAPMALRLHDNASATSGDYERFVEIQGVRYAHIMNPKTGRPVRQRHAVSVTAARAVYADALSTALFVAGKPLVDKVPQAPYQAAVVQFIEQEK